MMEANTSNMAVPYFQTKPVGKSVKFYRNQWDHVRFTYLLLVVKQAPNCAETGLESLALSGSFRWNRVGNKIKPTLW